MKNSGTIQGRLFNIETKMNTDELIIATVTIEVGDNRIPVAFIANAKKTNGEPNKAYAAFPTFAADAKTVVGFGDEADFVEAKMVSLKENLFSSDGNAIVSNTNITANFFSRIPATEPIAEINIGGVVMSAVETIKNDIPTGELELVIEYTNVFNNKPFTEMIKLNVSNPAHVAFVKTNYTPGMEVALTVEPHVTEETIETVIADGGFGGAIIETKPVKTRKLEVIKGGAATTPLIADEVRAEGRAGREGRVVKAKEKAKKKASGTATAPKSAGASMPSFTL